MSSAKIIMHRIIDEIPESQLAPLFEYAVHIKQKSESHSFDDLLEASRSSMSFWENDIDDEVWNNV
jgi:hypothetical protein